MKTEKRRSGTKAFSSDQDLKKMSPTLNPGPADAKITDAFAIIRAGWKANLDSVTSGQSSFWLGSAISSARFEPLGGLLRALLVKLHGLSGASAACPYRAALKSIIRVTSINPATLDPSASPTTWPQLDEIIAQLRNQYSRVLAIPILTSPALKIPWDILRLQDVYSDDATEPDAEHRCIAAMVEEGFLSQVVTTNWDPLIEKAYRQARGTKSDELNVVACNDDLAGAPNGAAPRLLKIHGCAKKSVSDAAKYQPFMVATVDEIVKWDNSAEPLAEATRTLLRESPSLFVGLSGQDFNLQALFAKVQNGRTQPFPPEPPRVIFCAQELSADQYAILKLLYGEMVYDSNAAKLNKEAALPLFGKPLLGSLYLLGIKEKISSLLRTANTEIPTVFLDMSLRVLEAVENQVCAAFDTVTVADERWRAVTAMTAKYVSRMMSLYRSQALLAGEHAYEPITAFNIPKAQGLGIGATGNLHWLFLSLACILEGAQRGYWTLEVPVNDDPAIGHFILRAGGDAASLFLIDRAVFRSRLEKLALSVDPAANRVIILYPVDNVPPPSPRLPKRLLPGGVSDPDELTELSMPELLEGSSTVDQLMDALKKAISTGRRIW